MICIEEIINFAENELDYEDNVIWACQELSSLMIFVKKAQEYNDNKMKDDVASCIVLLLGLFFSRTFLGQSEEDYFMLVSEKLSELPEEEQVEIMKLVCNENDIVIADDSDNVLEEKIREELFKKNGYSSY